MIGLSNRQGTGRIQTGGGSTMLGLSAIPIDEESDNMHKIKGEFVEYVKEILTKTTSQVANSNAGGVSGKQKT